MAKSEKKSKNKRTFEEKSQIVISAMRDRERRVKAAFPASPEVEYGKAYTMAELAHISDYARSSRFMLFLYEMCDRGMLVKQEFSEPGTMTGRGICDVNIYFLLPEYANARRMKSMFTEAQL